MSPFLRGVLARRELEHEERMAAPAREACVVDRACIDCGVELHRNNRSGRCRPCHLATRDRSRGRCDCGAVALLGKGVCRTCHERDSATFADARGVRASAIVAAVQALGEASAEDVAEAVGLSQDSAGAALSRAVRAGRLTRVEWGRYAVADLSLVPVRRLAQRQDSGT